MKEKRCSNCMQLIQSSFRLIAEFSPPAASLQRRGDLYGLKESEFDSQAIQEGIRSIGDTRRAVDIARRRLFAGFLAAQNAGELMSRECLFC